MLVPICPPYLLFHCVQHSPAVRTADLYKRLYSRGWRSKYHSTGRHDVDLNNNHNNNNSAGNNNNNRTSRLKPTDTATKTVKSTTTNQQQQPQAAKTTTTAKQQLQQQVLVPCKDEPAQQQPLKESSRPASRDAAGVKDMDIEGLLREPTNKDHANNTNNNNINNNQNSDVEGGGNTVVVVPVDNGVVINTKSTVEVIVEDNASANAKEVNNNNNNSSNGNGFAERSPKRPKRECRIAAEGAAVRQGLRSSTCAM